MGTDNQDSVVGEAQPIGGKLLVSTIDRLAVINTDTGKLEGESKPGVPGNILALPDQVVLASMQEVRGYLPWSIAKSHLQTQIDQAPADSRPGLALAFLAARSGNSASVVPGVESALAAAAQSDTMEQRDARTAAVFGEMLALVELTKDAPHPVRSELFDSLARATTSPADEVAYQFTFGSYLEETGRHKQAVDHYQSVLLDPLLAQELFRSDRSVRQASLEAQQRLIRLIDERGRAIYQDYDIMAQRMLDELRNDPTVQAKRFDQLSEQLPLASNVAQVRLEAARRHQQAGAAARAISQLRRAYAQVEDDVILAEVLSELVGVYEATQRFSLARQWLRRAAREHPGLLLQRQDTPLTPLAWVEQIAGRAGGESLLGSFTGPIGEPTLIREQLMMPRTHRPSQPAGDAVITRENGQLNYRMGRTLDTLWSRPAGPSVQVLAMSDTQVLLWDATRETLSSLDARTGKPLWAQVDVASEFNEMAEPREARDHQPNGQRELARLIGDQRAVVQIRRPAPPMEANNSPTHLDVSEDMIVIGRRDGRLIGIARSDGKLMWRLTAGVDRLSHLLLDQGTLVLGGVSGAQTESAGGVVVVLDPSTGESMLPPIEEGQAIRWVGVSDDAQLLFATQDMLYCHRLVTGDVAWRLATRAMPVTGHSAKQLGPSLLMQDQTGSMLVVDIAAGAFVQRVRPATVGLIEPARVKRSGGGWAMLHVNQLTVTDDGGQLLWHDAVEGVPKNMRQVLVGERVIAVLAQAQGLWQDGARAAPTDADYRLYLFDRETGRLTHQASVGPFVGPIDVGTAVLLDGRLIYGVGNRTLVIPDADHNDSRL